MNELGEPMLLKNYLLGRLDDESVQVQIEERLMIDEDFAAQVSVVEEELIEEFLDGEMTADESDRFNRFFLAPPERKRQLRLTRDLRRVSALKSEEIPQPTSGRSIFSIGWLRFSIAAAAVVIGALGVWRFAIYESATAKGLGQLRAAYRDNRPVESRLTGLPDYAPYPETRGDQVRVTDPSALSRAGLFLAESTRDSADAPAHQALATYHLARGEVSDAEREMKAALQASPSDARIQSDASAMYLQIASKSSNNSDELIALNESLRHSNRAIELNPKLVEPYFNRALALGKLRFTEEAKAAWQKYLEIDPASGWTREAKDNLQKLEHETPTERSAEKLETDFLDAYRSSSHTEAEKLVALNREPINDKYLPVRLSMSLLSADPDRRDELRHGLEYIGEIEMKLTGDPFAKEIALFYRAVPRERMDPLSRAHLEMRKGFGLLKKAAYSDALAVFQKSQRMFDAAGDIYAARIAQYFTGYALENLDRNDEALNEMQTIAEWAAERNFSWLRMTALHWVASCQVNAKQLTAARRTFEHALSIAEKINDSYAIQRNLSALAHLYSTCGQEREALSYIFAAVKESDKPQTSLRQRFRNLFLTLPIVFRARLFSVGMPAAMEVMRSADQQNDQMWMSQSRAFAGRAAAQMGDLLTARTLLEESRSKAAAIGDDNRERISALANLMFADVERSFGDATHAEELYRDALRYYDSAKQPFLREEARQGLLQTYLKSGNSDALREEIPPNIALAEEYRTKILDEDQSIGFFDLKGGVYDVAAEFAFDSGRLEDAYDYAEASSSRALLNRMQAKTNVRSEDPAPGSPLKLTEIRAQMPAGSRIVQYSVFEKKSVVWIVSRSGVNAVVIATASSDLSDRVSKFSQAISDPATAESDETKRLGAELYKLLIQPVLSSLDPGEELCIIPNKFLFDLPFAALIDANGKPLISTFRLVYAPSANVFLAGSRHAAARSGVTDESLLAVGDPAFERRRFDDLNYLPDSAQEAVQISQLYRPAKTLVREQATKSAFLDALADSDVIHFAGHYVAMPGTPMSSFLLLAADGDDPSKSELSNAELSQVSIPRARLIVLAACRSGVESYYRSEGMAGMSRTVLAAQIPLVVASQWSVDSAGTEELMTRFHELRRKQHLATTAALQQAQLALSNDPSGKFSSPYYWAAFAVYGGHADF